MAGTQGTVVVFDQFIEDIFIGTDIGHDFGATAHAVNCSIINDAVAPLVTDAKPLFGTTGTPLPNHKLGEQTGTNYPTLGRVCSNAGITDNAGTIELDFDDPAVWSQNSGNPTDCEYGIIFNNTLTDKQCIAWVELGATTFNATTGDLTITWGAPFATINQA
jgi:hypothetical protein